MLKRMGAPPCFFSVIFTTRNNFRDFLKRSLFLMERICSLRANSFLKELTLNKKEDKKESGQICTHEKIKDNLNRFHVTVDLNLQMPAWVQN